MRSFIAVVIVAALSLTPSAQALARGKKQQQNTQNTEDQAKKKAADDAYSKALKTIPASNEKQDPWKTMR